MTQEELKQILDYDPETGLFRWKIKPSKKINIGDVAGALRPDGYIQIRINKKDYSAHRLAWLYVTGDWPVNTVDHINRIRNDNQISNLRDITNQEQQFHKGNDKRNTSGYKGASWSKQNKKWRAAIGVNGKIIYLGLFNTKEAASEAYQEAKEKYHKI